MFVGLKESMKNHIHNPCLDGASCARLLEMEVVVELRGYVLLVFLRFTAIGTIVGVASIAFIRRMGKFFYAD